MGRSTPPPNRGKRSENVHTGNPAVRSLEAQRDPKTDERNGEKAGLPLPTNTLTMTQMRHMVVAKSCGYSYRGFLQPAYVQRERFRGYPLSIRCSCSEAKCSTELMLLLCRQKAVGRVCLSTLPSLTMFNLPLPCCCLCWALCCIHSPTRCS